MADWNKVKIITPGQKNQANIHLVDFNDIFTSSTTAEGVGQIVAFGTSASQYGFIGCTGVDVSRITYSTLFSKIGEKYGSGIAANTFHIPDVSADLTACASWFMRYLPIGQGPKGDKGEKGDQGPQGPKGSDGAAGGGTGGSSTVTNLSSVLDVCGNASAGDFLAYDGTHWVPQSAAGGGTVDSSKFMLLGPLVTIDESGEVVIVGTSDTSVIITHLYNAIGNRHYTFDDNI
jgi:hypothetical protein